MSSPDSTSSSSPVDRYVSVNEACAQFSISRATFYRMLDAPSSGLREIVIRVPPVTGHLRIPLNRFERWLQARPSTGRRGAAS
jgi:hypothetical protein